MADRELAILSDVNALVEVITDAVLRSSHRASREGLDVEPPGRSGSGPTPLSLQVWATCLPTRRGRGAASGRTRRHVPVGALSLRSPAERRAHRSSGSRCP